MYRIVRYDAGYVNQWNEFVGSSINSTFLFHRDFMEYHSDRFTDFSLIVFDGTNLVALLPANRSGNEVHSHQGLTYGGLLLRDTIGVEKIETIFRAVLQFLEGEDIAVLKIKQIVSIYQKKPAFAMDYLLFKYNAHMYRRDMNLAIDFSRPPSVSRSKKKHFRRVSSLGLEVRKDNDFGTFWDDVLIPRLQERHNAKPVHTKDEIAMLHEKFPDRILQYNVYINDAIVAGITLFHFGNVIKSQYGATTAEGE
ncbi:MAG: FemAB family protein, partial [Flavobacterium sp.]